MIAKVRGHMLILTKIIFAAAKITAISRFSKKKKKNKANNQYEHECCASM